MRDNAPEDLTTLLAAVEEGDGHAAARLADAVYVELRQLAHAILQGERPQQTLRTTALVNEAWLRLVGERANIAFDDRRHFYRTAARAMRTILIDYARARRAAKRGGSYNRLPLDDVIDAIEIDRVDLVALDDAMQRLEALSARRCRVVELRFFAGLSIEQTARVLGVSHGTVENDWSFARAWLHRNIAGDCQ